MQRPYRQIDVFTTRAYRGNRWRSCSTDRDSTASRCSGAHWTNLGDDVVLAPNDPAPNTAAHLHAIAELPFAGHPTLGTATPGSRTAASPARDT